MLLGALALWTLATLPGAHWLMGSRPIEVGAGTDELDVQLATNKAAAHTAADVIKCPRDLRRTSIGVPRVDSPNPLSCRIILPATLTPQTPPVSDLRCG